MSTCPNEDGYSVYLDGEIPIQHDKIYGKHLDNCNTCKETYKKMQKLQSILREDAQNIQFNEHKLNNSYSRLQSLLAFQNNTKTRKSNLFSDYIKQVLPALAAILILGIFIPLKFTKTETDDFTPTLHTINPTARLITSKGIIAEKRLSQALENSSLNLAHTNLEFNPNMIITVDVLRPSTLNETNTLKIKIFDKSDSFSNPYSGLYQTSYFPEGRILP